MRRLVVYEKLFVSVLKSSRVVFYVSLARPSLEKYNILAQSTTFSFRRCPMMIALNRLDSF